MVRTNSDARTDARTYSELSLLQLCLAHRKRARQKSVCATNYQGFTAFYFFTNNAFVLANRKSCSYEVLSGGLREINHRKLAVMAYQGVDLSESIMHI